MTGGRGDTNPPLEDNIMVELQKDNETWQHLHLSKNYPCATFGGQSLNP